MPAFLYLLFMNVVGYDYLCPTVEFGSTTYIAVNECAISLWKSIYVLRGSTQNLFHVDSILIALPCVTTDLSHDRFWTHRGSSN